VPSLEAAHDPQVAVGVGVPRVQAQRVEERLDRPFQVFLRPQAQAQIAVHLGRVGHEPQQRPVPIGRVREPALLEQQGREVVARLDRVRVEADRFGERGLRFRGLAGSRQGAPRWKWNAGSSGRSRTAARP
jgi:hypothetical protein